MIVGANNFLDLILNNIRWEMRTERDNFAHYGIIKYLVIACISTGERIGRAGSHYSVPITETTNL